MSLWKKFGEILLRFNSFLSKSLFFMVLCKNINGEIAGSVAENRNQGRGIASTARICANGDSLNDGVINHFSSRFSRKTIFLAEWKLKSHHRNLDSGRRTNSRVSERKHEARRSSASETWIYRSFFFLVGWTERDAMVVRGKPKRICSIVVMMNLARSAHSRFYLPMLFSGLINWLISNKNNESCRKSQH